MKLNKPIEPLFPWQGGKRKYIQKIYELAEVERDRPYCEPFLGGGAMFCDYTGGIHDQPCIINDFNGAITSILCEIKLSPESFYMGYKIWEDKYLSLPPVPKGLRGRGARDKEPRHRFFNALRFGNWWHYSNEIQLLLQWTSFNNLWLPSLEAETTTGLPTAFGTAAGNLRETKPMVSYKNIMGWHERLQRTTIYNCSYDELKPIEGSFIYLDPPYINCDNRGNYSNDTWSFEEQAKLIDWAHQQKKRGCQVVISNKSDGYFFERLYQEGLVSELHYFDAFHSGGRRKRVINEEGEIVACEGHKVREVVIVV